MVYGKHRTGLPWMIPAMSTRPCWLRTGNRPSFLAETIATTPLTKKWTTWCAWEKQQSDFCKNSEIRKFGTFLWLILVAHKEGMGAGKSLLISKPHEELPAVLNAERDVIMMMTWSSPACLLDLFLFHALGRKFQQDKHFSRGQYSTMAIFWHFLLKEYSLDLDSDTGFIPRSILILALFKKFEKGTLHEIKSYKGDNATQFKACVTPLSWILIWKMQKCSFERFFLVPSALLPDISALFK